MNFGFKALFVYLTRKTCSKGKKPCISRGNIYPIVG